MKAELEVSNLRHLEKKEENHVFCDKSAPSKAAAKIREFFLRFLKDLYHFHLILSCI